MEYRMLSSNTTKVFTTQCVTVGDAKRNIACNEKLRSFRSVDIVCIDTGTIYADEVNLSSFRTSEPILVMIGNEDRKFPSYLETDEKDPICPDGDEPRFLMPCRHATTPENLFGRMKSSLGSGGSFPVRCTTHGCDMVWEISDIMKRADLTEDEKIFFTAKSSLVSMRNLNVETCPKCTAYCQINSGSPSVSCAQCSDYTFCIKCKDAWKDGHTCDIKDVAEMQKILDEANKKDIDYCNVEGVPDTRMCPSCKRLIQHDSMCKHMKCLCGAKFCFVCLTFCEDSNPSCTDFDTKCRPAPTQKC
ncbi:E3 ubiquitin-protein ligase ariadne-1-like isoform X2 [Ostrea edulis]|uniref:E3 ubiquitin-protein ligase ariadne-1-like isoform X2 n=1 Tax=Ostrea edulis TaxID=37623 RepID=UPI0024AF309B|nr:E3 ubiquitin-protein ligase ariadne-1-like isoform X2 [Ostrea edulis]